MESKEVLGPSALAVRSWRAKGHGRLDIASAGTQRRRIKMRLSKIAPSISVSICPTYWRKGVTRILDASSACWASMRWI